MRPWPARGPLAARPRPEAPALPALRVTDPTRPIDRPAEPAAAPPAPGGSPYGPQTLAIRRFLQHLAALAPAAWDAIAAEFPAHAARPAYARADRALGLVIERAAREAERDAALGPLVQLVRLPSAPDAPAPPAGDDAADVPLHPVAEPALAAVLALLVRDLIPAASLDALYAPVAAHVPVERLAR